MLIPWPATVGSLDDGTPGSFAMVDCLPEIIGHGEDDDEALDDLQAQIDAIEWH